MSKDQEPATDAERGKGLPIFRIAIVVLLACVTGIIVLQNTEAVETRLLFTTVTMPRAVLLFSTLAAGFIGGLTAAFLRGRSRRKA